MILQNANVVTVDSEDSVHTSIAIEGERIIAVGSDHDMERLTGSDTIVLDMEGRTITPGLVDSHNHTCEYGFSEMILDLRYPSVTSIQGIVDKVRKAAESKPKGTWIRGVGWDDALLEEKRPPTRQDFDPVSPDHPVILSRWPTPTR
jgi:predicted amidohydrolase YtcJ